MSWANWGCRRITSHSWGVSSPGLSRMAHLANIVLQRSTPYLHQFGFGHAYGGSQLLGYPGHPLGVALGLAVSQIQCLRPAFDGLIAGDRQFKVGAMKARKSSVRCTETSRSHKANQLPEH